MQSECAVKAAVSEAFAKVPVRKKLKLSSKGAKIMKCIKKSNERFALHGKLLILKISLLKSRAV